MKEKKVECIQEALNFLDEDLIAEVDQLRKGYNSSEVPEAVEAAGGRKNANGQIAAGRSSWRRWAAMAASVALVVVAAGWAVAGYGEGNAGTGMESVLDEESNDRVEHKTDGEASDETVIEDESVENTEATEAPEQDEIEQGRCN